MICPSPLQAFSASLADADWIRFEWYARRVRCLAFEDYQGTIYTPSKLSHSVFDQLVTYRPPGPLTPNLRAIRWTAWHGYTGLGLLLFSTPKTQSLALTLHGYSLEVYSSLFKTLSHNTLILKHLELGIVLPGGGGPHGRNHLTAFCRMDQKSQEPDGHRCSPVVRIQGARRCPAKPPSAQTHLVQPC